MSLNCLGLGLNQGPARLASIPSCAVLPQLSVGSQLLTGAAWRFEDTLNNSEDSRRVQKHKRTQDQRDQLPQSERKVRSREWLGGLPRF